MGPVQNNIFQKVKFLKMQIKAGRHDARNHNNKLFFEN